MVEGGAAEAKVGARRAILNDLGPAATFHRSELHHYLSMSSSLSEELGISYRDRDRARLDV